MGVDPLHELRTALAGDYDIHGFLDGGGQGAIYRAVFKGEDVALKIFRPGTDQRRLDRELYALGGINCPYLAAVRDYREIQLGGDRLSVVSYEFLPGGDLRQYITPSAASLDERLLLCIGTQVATALSTLWRARIVHRDIKPANIVRASDVRYVLVDLGLARHVDRSALTLPGALPGTMGYQSPEQASGRRNLTIHSDIFSLGVTLYEIATKRHPFGRAQHLIGRTNAAPLRQHRPDLSDGLARLIHQMMSITPVERPYNICDRFRQLEAT